MNTNLDNNTFLLGDSKNGTVVTYGNEIVNSESYNELFTTKIVELYNNIKNYLFSQSEYFDIFLIVSFFVFLSLLITNMFQIKKYNFKLINFGIVITSLIVIIFSSYNILGVPYHIKNYEVFIKTNNMTYKYISHIEKDLDDDLKLIYLWLLDKNEIPFSVAVDIDLNNEEQKNDYNKFKEQLKKMMSEGGNSENNDTNDGKERKGSLNIKIINRGNVPSFETEFVIRNVTSEFLPRKK